MKPINNSVKRSVYKGRKEVVDNHGELSLAVVLEYKQRDQNYVKLFMPDNGDYFMRPKSMTIASIHLFEYLCIIATPDNSAVTTKAQIEERTGLSRASVTRAKDQLKQMDYIRQQSNSVYIINPCIAVKVDGNKRLAIWTEYQKVSGKQLNTRS